MSMTREEALHRLRQICTGIDKDTLEDDDGWWETSVGVEFGAARLRDLERLIEQLTPQCDVCHDGKRCNCEMQAATDPEFVAVPCACLGFTGCESCGRTEGARTFGWLSEHDFSGWTAEDDTPVVP